MGRGKEIRRINSELVRELEEAGSADRVELVDRRTGEARVVDFMFVAGMYSASVGMRALYEMGEDELAGVDGESFLKAAVGAYFDSQDKLEVAWQRK